MYVRHVVRILYVYNICIIDVLYNIHIYIASTGTTTLKYHIEVSHPKEYKELADEPKSNKRAGTYILYIHPSICLSICVKYLCIYHNI
jgi:hypothetical protein